MQIANSSKKQQITNSNYKAQKAADKQIVAKWNGALAAEIKQKELMMDAANAVAANAAMQAKQSAAKNIAMLKDLVDAALEDDAAFDSITFADAIDMLEAMLATADCLGGRVI